MQQKKMSAMLSLVETLPFPGTLSSTLLIGLDIFQVCIWFYNDIN